MTLDVTRIVAVRHGQTGWNALGRIQGHTDIALDATGGQIAVTSVSTALFLPPSLQSWQTYFLQIGLTPIGIAFHPTRPLAFINLGATNRLEMVDLRTLKNVGTVVPEGPPYTVPTFTYVWPPHPRFSPDGSKLYLPVPDGIREIPVPSEPFELRGATTYGLKGEIALALSAPIAPSTANN